MVGGAVGEAEDGRGAGLAVGEGGATPEVDRFLVGSEAVAGVVEIEVGAAEGGVDFRLARQIGGGFELDEGGLEGGELLFG